MAEWRKICCAIDFSDASRFAMEEACDVARRFRAELLLVHVHEPPPPSGMGMLTALEGAAELVAVDLERSLAAWRAEAARRSGAAVRSAVRVGSPATEILKLARDEAVDLLVLATHGRRGLAHLVLGSVAERVLREAPCPVLIIRQKELTEAALLAREVAEET